MDYLPYLYYIGRVKEYRILHSSFFTLRSSLFTFLLPLNYTLYLIFRELAIVGDIYRGQHEFHTQPWLSVTYTINPT